MVIRGWLIYLHHLLGNCRAAVISFFSTYYHLFSYPRNKVQCPCVGYIFFHLQSNNCPRYKVQCPCVGRTTSFTIISLFTILQLTLHQSISSTECYSFKRASTSLSIFQISLRFTPTVKQDSSTSSVSFGVLVYYFGWVVCIFTLYMYILVLYIGEGITLSKFFIHEAPTLK